MCGIVALAGHMNQPEVNLFKAMLELDTVRGRHSTGIAAIPMFSNQFRTIKDTVPGWEFTEKENVKKFFTTTDVLYIGHNRHATMGAVNKDNAHPFSHGNIIGVHNGSLNYNYDDHLFDGVVFDEGVKPSDFGTDSEGIFYVMSKLGVEETIKRVHGDFALVWYNIDDDTLNFVRNKGRPLCMAGSKDGKNFVLSSDSRVFHLANDSLRGVVTLAHENNLMSLVPENTWFRVPLPQKTNEKFDPKKAWDSAVTVYPATHRKTFLRPARQQYPSMINGWDIEDSPFIGATPPKAPKQQAPANHNNGGYDDVRCNFLWDQYNVRSSNRKKDPQYVGHVAREAKRLTDKTVIGYVERYKTADANTVRVYMNPHPVLNTYSVSQTELVLALHTDMDFASDVMSHYYDNLPDAEKELFMDFVKNADANDLVDKLSKKEKKSSNGSNQASTTPVEQKDTIDSKKAALSRKQRKQLKRLKQEASQRPPSRVEPREVLFLDKPSGCASLTNFQFKKLIRDEGCSVCHSQDIGWDGAMSGLTKSDRLICPDCLADNLIQDQINFGVIQLQSANPYE